MISSPASYLEIVSKMAKPYTAIEDRAHGLQVLRPKIRTHGGDQHRGPQQGIGEIRKTWRHG
jgi:hypothetical protein